MITFVNTVLVGTGVGTIASSMAANKGQYVVVDGQGAVIASAADAAKAEAIKVGLANGKSIKWSHIIKKDAIKSYHFTGFEAETEDEVVFDFATAVAAAADKDIRVVVRLTFKDMDTRYRKWSESYEVYVKTGSTAKAIVDAFVESINVKNAKRARVEAENDGDTLKLTAMAYDDDNAIDTISPLTRSVSTVMLGTLYPMLMVSSQRTSTMLLLLLRLLVSGLSVAGSSFVTLRLRLWVTRAS